MTIIPLKIFTHVYLYQRSLYLHMALSYCVVSFHLTWRTPCSISYRAGLMIRNSFNFYLEMSSFNPSFLKDSLGYRSLNWQFSSSQDFKYFSLLEFWLPRFLLRILLMFSLRIPYMWWVVFFLLLWIFSLCLCLSEVWL